MSDAETYIAELLANVDEYIDGLFAQDEDGISPDELTEDEWAERETVRDGRKLERDLFIEARDDVLDAATNGTRDEYAWALVRLATLLFGLNQEKVQFSQRMQYLSNVGALFAHATRLDKKASRGRTTEQERRDDVKKVLFHSRMHGMGQEEAFQAVRPQLSEPKESYRAWQKHKQQQKKSGQLNAIEAEICKEMEQHSSLARKNEI